MSKLEELIQQYCPDGVEYVKIGEIAQVGTGSSNGNEAIEDGIYPFFVRSQIIKKKDTYEYDEEAIIIPGEGGIGDIFHYINGKYALHQRVYRIHFISPHINVKFAFYYMKSAFKKFIMAKAVSSTVSSIRKPMIEGFSLPIPPLPVQEEIVRILDTFTELQAELQAELQKRKQQYNYYLDNLLNFNDINRGGQAEVRWMKMNNIAKLSRGRVISKDYLQNNAGIYPVYSSQTANNGELGQINTYDYNGNYLTWTTDGAYAGTIFKRNGCFSITNVCGLIALTSELVNLDYLYYWLKITAPSFVYKGMGNPKLMSNVMESILIPIIPLTEQQRIVSILDRFDTLTTDLTQGLPAEIEKRKQQYEYYRDKLLTFKRKGA